MRKPLLGISLTTIVLIAACKPVSEPTPQPAPLIATSAPQQASTASPAPTEAAAPEPTAAPNNVTAFPNAEEYSWQVVAKGFNQPLDVQHAGDGSRRLFIVERVGAILIMDEDGFVLPAPFLDISDKVTTKGSEQGLLGLAFHPAYAENGTFFINYTDLNGNTVIARYQVSSDANQADAASESVLFHIEQPYGNHNGGGLDFGPDGFLYIGLGDGGSANDPLGNGQKLDTYLGKLLRVDVDGAETYLVPADNPFLAGEGLPEIWAYGLRNPWRFSFDSLTGDLYIADVGQNIWEEVNFLPAGAKGGANFGWNYREGAHPFAGQPPADLVLIDPVAEYDHEEGCSVTGGAVYRGDALPAWNGVYFYGDYCGGQVWGLLNVNGVWQSELLFYTGATITSFGEGEDGAIYFTDYTTNALFQLTKK